MMEQAWLFDLCGLLGVACIISTYLLTQLDKLSNRHMAYPLINLIGALLVLVSLTHFWNLASFVIELFWIAISIVGIIRIYWQRRQQKAR